MLVPFYGVHSAEGLLIPFKTAAAVLSCADCGQAKAPPVEEDSSS